MSEQNQKQPKFGRAFNAAISTDWLITEDAFRSLLEVAARINLNSPVAVDPKNQPDYRDGWDRAAEDKVAVRNGVAVIEITGPIFRYANPYTYFCGATNVNRLARNLNAALDDPQVSSIMFEVNSPGGEVTGINEFAQMVYRARSRKPISARVGGYGCSAAYWIASMCGDIALDKTAQVGSIGVMAVYIDDRKALEMEGLSEIEFISSQSPYKNSPPYSDEGRTRIQKRIDALAKVFVEAVAVGRGVSVKTVLETFGQGDVFVGQAAIDAGLADRLGSFEETIGLLAATHTPGFISGMVEHEPFPDPIPDNPETDDRAAEKTINEKLTVNSQLEHEADQTAASDSDDLIKNEEFMNEEKKDPTAADTKPETAEQQAPKAETPATSDSAGPKDSVANEDVATLKAELAKSLEAQAKADTKIAALEQAALDGWIDTAVEKLAGETASNKTILSALVAAKGKDSAEVAAFLESQKALTAQLEAGGFFSEIGKGGDGTDKSAEAQLEAKAKALMAADSKLTIQQARTTAYEQNPELYNALQEGK